MRKYIGWVAIAATTFGLSGVAFADSNGSSSKTSSNNDKSSSAACANDDAAKVREVLGFLHASNQAEIKLANLAKSKSSNDDVKTFADQMLKEHTDADKKLSDLAGKESVDLNAAPNDPLFAALKTAHDDAYSALSGKTGAQFDVGYIAPQGLDHEVVLNVIAQGEKVAKTQDEKTFFADARKMVTMHRDHAKQIISKLQFNTPSTTANKAIGGGPSSDTTTGAATDKSTTKSSPKSITPKSTTSNGSSSGAGNKGTPSKGTSSKGVGGGPSSDTTTSGTTTGSGSTR